MLSAAPDVAVQQDLPSPGALSYVQTNLVSNVQGMALITDPSLVNPWDVNFPQLPGINPPIYVADQGAGGATAYQISSDGSTVIDESSLAVTVPAVGFGEPSGPTGLVQNTRPGEFLIPGPDGSPIAVSYIFDTLQGTIGGYALDANGNLITNPAEIMYNGSDSPTSHYSHAEYTGLAVGTVVDSAGNGDDYIYAANEGTSPGIQVFDSSFGLVQLPDGKVKGNPNFTGNFTLPAGSLPAGFVPYGVRDLSLGAGSKLDADLFVTYRGPNFQGGAVAVFTNAGTFLGLIASDTCKGNLQSPWGLAYIGPGLFGDVGGDLLVGNFSSGQIDAYDVTLSPSEASGQFLGQLLNQNGTPLTIPGLRSIHFGPGLGDSGSTHVGLLFTAEINIPHIWNHNRNFEFAIPHVGNHIGNVSLYGEITPANVKLPTGTATGTGGISNIQQVDGGDLGDVLLGNDSGSPLEETAGKNLFFGGADGGAILDSGSGQDTVIAGSPSDDNNAVALQAIEVYWSTSGNDAGDTIDAEEV
jgi:uncharacterized protein (TIGR03118 family)